jgi:hypothetical protein
MRETFNKLTRLYHDRLVGFILIRISGGRQDAEDIAQNVWSRAWEILYLSNESDKYDHTKGSLYTWLINYLAIPKIKDWRKSQIRTDNLPDINDQLPETANDPGSLVLYEEELSRINSAFCELFRLTFLCGGYPHQQLAFALMKHIYGKESKRAIEGDARKVDADYGNRALKDVLTEYLVAYRKISQVDEKIFEDLYKHLEPVRIRLNLRVDKLIRPLPSHLVKQRRKEVKLTCFRDYYIRQKQSGTHPLTYWCDRLQERIRGLLRLENAISENAVVREIMNRKGREGMKLRPSSCNRCKLRHVPPCSKEEQKDVRGFADSK